MNLKIKIWLGFVLFFIAMLTSSFVYAENITTETTPYISIDPIGNQTIDSAFIITGTTNLPASSEPLLVQIEPFEINRAKVSSYFSQVTIQTGTNGINTWSANASTYKWNTSGPEYPTIPDNVTPDEYNVTVVSPDTIAIAVQSFFLLPSPSAPRPAETHPSNIPPVAAFGVGEVTASTGIGATTFGFTDLSSGFPTSWLWTFGDGNESTYQNPTHTYLKPGDYPITLTVRNQAGSNTVSTVLNIPIETMSTPQETSSQALSMNKTGFGSPTTPAASLLLLVPVMALFGIILILKSGDNRK